MTTNTSPVVNTFLEIVQIDSPTGHEEEMSKYVFNRLQSYDLDTIIDEEGNVHAFLQGDSSLEPIFLNAHLDTVDPGRGVVPTIGSDGWIRSDGRTVLGGDNKTSVAAILETIKKLIDSKGNHHPLDILFTVSEESNAHGAIGFDYGRLKSKKGYAFDISNEVFGSLNISAPFYNRLIINLKGKSGHAEAPEKAINVLPVFVKAMSELKLGYYSENTVINIGTINGGTATNTIPGELSLVGEVRSYLETELEEATNKYREVFEAESNNAGVVVNFEAVRENPGYKIGRDDPFLLETINTLRNFGLSPEIKDSFGCLDANYFAQHGLTTINISDATMGSHTTGEKVHVDNLNRLVDLIYFIVTN